MRVRTALSHARCRAALRGKLPKEAAKALEQDAGLAETIQLRSYPTPLLKLLEKADPAQDKYCLFGILTELLLREPASSLSESTLESVLRRVAHSEVPAKLFTTKTVARYLEHVKRTREQMEALIDGAELQVEAELRGNGVEGHPDFKTTTDVFEVKTSGRVSACWMDFLLQAFAYAALDSAIERVHLVLPLQATICSWDVRAWTHREAYKTALENVAASEMTRAPPPPSDMFESAQLFSLFPIGSHLKKHRCLAETLRHIADPSRPYQIFLGGPVSTRVNVEEDDLAECRAMVEARRLQVFIHAPYMINLAAMNEWNVPCLKKHLQAGAAMGAKGVVVHVGKACGKAQEAALENMRMNIRDVLDAATPECPLLLETPAGQGSELLDGGPEPFMTFVASFQDPRFGACIDTCHVFATAVRPLAYLRAVLENEAWAHLLHAVHFNDSKAPLGARVDRHAPIGYGCIGVQELSACASLVHAHRIPLIVE